MVNSFIAGIASNLIGKKLENVKPKLTRTQELINQGSQNFAYTAPIIAAGTTLWIEIAASFPQARTFLPLDFAEVINNSAQQITVFLNSVNESRVIPSYMIKPFRQPLRQIGIRNDGAVDTVAADILINFKRLPPNVQYVINAGTVSAT